MSSRAKSLLLLLTGGWFVLSLGGLGYVTLVQGEESPTQAVSRLSVDGSTKPVKAVEQTDPELEKLIYRYFPTKLAQHWEEVFIRDYFQDKKAGFFVDVGANHHKIRSTTHYLDVALGWTGIAIDPIVEFAEGYAEHRPGTKFLPFFVGETTDDEVDFYVVQANPRLSTGDIAVANDTKKDFQKRKVKNTTLTDLLDAHGVKRIDLFKMDIELWEPPALRGFDIDRFKPAFIVIEDHAPVRAEIRAYMAKHKYVLIERYTKWDGRNAYYVPEEDLRAFLDRDTAARP